MLNQHTSKILCVIAFTDLLAVSLVVPLVGAHLRSLGMSHFLIGFLGSVYAFVQLISSPVIGSWSDIRGHRVILIYTMLICSICYIIWGIATSFFVIFLTRIILGFFKNTQTLCKALIADIVPYSEHSDVLGKFNAVAGIGFMFGPSIGGHLAELENGFFYICCIVAFIFWINIALVFLFIHETPLTVSQDISCCKKENATNSLKSQLLSSFLLLKRIDWIQFWDILTLKFVLGFSQALFYSNYGLYIQESLKISPRWVGYTISFQGLIGAISSFLMGHVERIYHNDSTYNVRMLHGFIVLTLSFCILGLAPNFNYFLVGLVPLSASGAVLRVAGMEILLRRGDVDKCGSLMGASGSTSSIARLVAPVIAGVSLDFMGTQGIFILAFLISGIGAILAYYFLKKANNNKLN